MRCCRAWLELQAPRFVQYQDTVDVAKIVRVLRDMGDQWPDFSLITGDGALSIRSDMLAATNIGIVVDETEFRGYAVPSVPLPISRCRKPAGIVERIEAIGRMPRRDSSTLK